MATIVSFVAGLALHTASGSLDAALAVFFSVELAFPTIGFFILRRTGNRVGWIFLLAGFGLGLQAMFSGYGERALGEGAGTLPGGVIAAWMSEIVWLPQLVVATMFLFLLFPDGRLPSRRWRWLAWAGVIGTLIVQTTIMFAPTLYSFPELRAPLAGILPQTALDIAGTVGGLILLPAMLLALASVFVRYRRADGVARQQIKWFAYAAVVFLAAQFAFNVFELADDHPAFLILDGLSSLLVPVTVAFAISRYRLYDIDVVINRTLVYAALTAFLAGVYFVAVLVLGQLVAPVGGGSDVTVAASTLAVAALFRPARARIQASVDRRFYRRRYDAGRTLEEFAGRVRQQVELDALVGDLEQTIRNTLQPGVVFVWLATPSRRSVG